MGPSQPIARTGRANGAAGAEVGATIEVRPVRSPTLHVMAVRSRMSAIKNGA
jgi:hypothetical protein